MSEKLTSRERMLIAAKGGQPDRVPVAPFTWDYAAVFSGKSHREYTLDSKVMANCLLNYYHAFEPDALAVPAQIRRHDSMSQGLKVEGKIFIVGAALFPHVQQDDGHGFLASGARIVAQGESQTIAR